MDDDAIIYRRIERPAGSIGLKRDSTVGVIAVSIIDVVIEGQRALAASQIDAVFPLITGHVNASVRDRPRLFRAVIGAGVIQRVATACTPRAVEVTAGDRVRWRGNRGGGAAISGVAVGQIKRCCAAIRPAVPISGITLIEGDRVPQIAAAGMPVAACILVECGYRPQVKKPSGRG